MSTVLLMHGDDGVNPTVDPDWNSVTLQLDMETLADRKGHTVSLVGNTVLSTGDFKHGEKASYHDGDGTSYLLVGGSADYQFPGDFTFECWFKRTAHGAYNVIVEHGLYTNGIMIRPEGATSLSVFVNSGSAAYTTTMLMGTWYHLAVTRQSDVVRTFKDGVYLGQFTRAGTVNSTSAAIRLGSAAHTSGQSFQGYLDDVRITKGVARYTAGFTPPGPLPVLFSDIMGHPVVTFGDATVDTGIKVATAASMLFSGTGYVSSTHADYVLNTGAFTAELSFYASTPGVSKSLFWFSDDAYAYYDGADATVKFKMKKSDASTATISTGVVTLGQWNHVAFGREGTKIFVALNGTYSSATDPLYATNLTGNEIRIANTNSIIANLSGYIDEFRVYKGADIYNKDFVAPNYALTNLNIGVLSSGGLATLSGVGSSYEPVIVITPVTFASSGKGVVTLRNEQTLAMRLTVNAVADASFVSDGITQSSFTAAGYSDVEFSPSKLVCGVRMALPTDRVIPRSLRIKGTSKFAAVSNVPVEPVVPETKLRCAKFIIRQRNRARFGGANG